MLWAPGSWDFYNQNPSCPLSFLQASCEVGPFGFFCICLPHIIPRAIFHPLVPFLKGFLPFLKGFLPFLKGFLPFLKGFLPFPKGLCHPLGLAFPFCKGSFHFSFKGCRPFARLAAIPQCLLQGMSSFFLLQGSSLLIINDLAWEAELAFGCFSSCFSGVRNIFGMPDESRETASSSFFKDSPFCKGVSSPFFKGWWSSSGSLTIFTSSCNCRKELAFSLLAHSLIWSWSLASFLMWKKIVANLSCFKLLQVLPFHLVLLTSGIEVSMDSKACLKGPGATEAEGQTANNPFTRGATLTKPAGSTAPALLTVSYWPRSATSSGFWPKTCRSKEGSV